MMPFNRLVRAHSHKHFLQIKSMVINARECLLNNRIIISKVSPASASLERERLEKMKNKIDSSSQSQARLSPVSEMYNKELLDQISKDFHRIDDDLKAYRMKSRTANENLSKGSCMKLNVEEKCTGMRFRAITWNAEQVRQAGPYGKHPDPAFAAHGQQREFMDHRLRIDHVVQQRRIPGDDFLAGAAVHPGRSCWRTAPWSHTLCHLQSGGSRTCTVSAA